MNTKLCKPCGKVLPLESFHWKIAGKKRNWMCRDCQREYRKKFYIRNRDFYISKAKSNRHKYTGMIRQKILEIKSGKPCLDCGGIFHPCQMDFDHLRDKSFTISRAARSHNCGITRLLAEIDKCELVCANCHRLRTYNRRRAEFP